MTTPKMYELSAAADRDLQDIFDYTTEKFGFEQAVKYVSEFEILFSQLVNNPHLGKSRDEIKAGLKSFSKSSHVVFYRILRERIRIVRILHANRDMPKLF